MTEVMTCTNCHLVTTKQEAKERGYRKGACKYCGGKLISLTKGHLPEDEYTVGEVLSVIGTLLLGAILIIGICVLAVRWII